MSKSSHLLIACCASFLASHVAAQPTADPDTANREGVVDLDPMVVLSKSPGRYEKLTGTATRLDSSALERLRPLGTQEALERMPGVQGFADDGFGNSRLNIGIRGLPPRRSSRVLILEDGIPIAPALYVYPNMYYNPPAERLDEIELIKGAAALEHGPQTMGGVINYITRRPRREYGGRVQLMGGENGYGSVYAEVGGWGTETLHPEVQLLYKRGDGFRENNAFEQYNATFKLNWIADERDAYYLKFNADFEDADATYTGLTEHSFETDPNFNPKEHDTFGIQRYSLDLIRTRELDHGVQTTKLYGAAFSRDWWREDDIFVKPDNWRNHQETGAPLNDIRPEESSTQELIRVGGGESNFGNLRDFYTFGLDNSWELRHRIAGRSGTLNLGARVHWERFLDRRRIGDAADDREGAYYEPADSSLIPGAARQNYETLALALYAAEEVEVGRLTVRPGLRLEAFEQERVDLLRGSRYVDHIEYVLLPGLGANYSLTDRIHLFGGIHRGYTPPSTSTLLLHFARESADPGSSDLRSEKSWNSELGVRFANSWTSMELSAYHLYIEDLVAPATGATFKNLGKARSYGLEAGGTVAASEPVPFLPDLHFAYTWLASEVLEGEIPESQSAGGTADIAGNRLPYAPEHTVVAGLSRDFGFGLSLGANVKYVSWVYTDYENLEFTQNRGDTGPIDGYVIYGASAGYEFGRFRVFVNAKNLLDNVYVSSRLHSHPSGKQAFQSSGILIGPRRQVNGGVSMTF